MSHPTVRDAVRMRLQQWADTRVVSFDNNRNPFGDSNDPWVGVQYISANSDQICLGQPGTRLWRERGYIQLLVGVRPLSGSVAAETYARGIAKLFRGVAVSTDLVFEGVSPPESYSSAREVVGNWYILAQLVGYHFTFTDEEA